MTRTCRRRRRRRVRRYHKVRAMRPEHKRQPERGRRPKRKRFIRVYEDTEGVFRAAISAGVLSADPLNRFFAGSYTYMFHDEEGTAWFRRRDTGARVPMSAKRHAAGEIS